jgi:hypothetical protein
VADDRIDIKIGASIEGLTANLTKVRESIEGLTDPIRGMRNNLGELGDAFVATFAIDKIVDFSRKMDEAGERVLFMGETLGIAVPEISALNSAMEIVGVGADHGAMAMMRLERAASEAQKPGSQLEDVFRRLGITATDASGKVKSGAELLGELADRFKDAPNDLNKLGAAWEIFGRGLGDSLLPFLNRGREGIEELEQAAQRAGTAIDTGMAQRMAEGAERSRELGQALDGLGEAIEAKFGLLRDFDNAWTSIIEHFTQFLGVTNAAKMSNLLDQIAPLMQQLDKIKGELATTGLTEPAVRILEGEKKAIEAQLAALNEARSRLSAEMQKETAGGAGSGTSPIRPPSDLRGGAADGGAKDARDLQRELNDELRQRISLIQDAAGVSSAYYARLMSDERLLLTEGNVSVAQELAAEIALEQEKTALRIRSLDQELTLYHEGEAEYARVEAQKKEVTQQSLAAIDALWERYYQQQREQNEKTAREFQQVFVSPVTRSFDELVSGLMNHGQSLSATLDKVFDNMAESFVESIAKMIAQWLAFEAVTALFGGGAASGLGMSAGPLGSLFSGGFSSLFSGGGAGAGAEIAGTGVFAEGSWSVPNTGAALVHAGEMILPAGFSEALRGGNVSLGGSGAAFNINLSSIDSRSAAAFFNNPTVARQLHAAISRNAPVT